GWLQVAEDHWVVPLMQIGQQIAERDPPAHHQILAQGTAAAHHLIEVLARHELLDDVAPPILLEYAVEMGDQRMGKAAEQIRLAGEPTLRLALVLGAGPGRETQFLQHHLPALQELIARLIDHAHAAAMDSPHDREPSGKQGAGGQDFLALKSGHAQGEAGAAWRMAQAASGARLGHWAIPFANTGAPAVLYR